MHYTYDEDKRARNIEKHGLDFKQAREVIEQNPTVTFEDQRFDYGEQRFITLGLLQGTVVALATTETDQVIRVISMRKATKNEQDIYYRNL